MGNIRYDPERILNGFTEDGLKDIAKRLKRRVRSIKNDIILDIISPPKGKPADWGKVWQEINRNLRKELESFSQEEFEIFSLSDTPLEDQFKISYMLTLSSNPEVKAKGELLYSQAQQSECRGQHPLVEAGSRADKVIEKAEKVKRDDKDEQDGQDEQDEHKDDEKALEVLAVITADIETRVSKEQTQTRDNKEPITISSLVKERQERQETQGNGETRELQKRIKTLEKRLRTTNSEGQRTKGQLEKLKNDWIALKAQWLKDQEVIEKYRNRVRELEVERLEKNKEIEILKKKLKKKSHKDNLPAIKVEHRGDIDFAAYQGRKALIFAEHDNDIDIRLKALGVIPIWAMDIDWNRPRRRMSTCQIILYKMDNEKLNKLDEIRDIARYLNIPCNELLDV